MAEFHPFADQEREIRFTVVAHDEELARRVADVEAQLGGIIMRFEREIEELRRKLTGLQSVISELHAKEDLSS